MPSQHANQGRTFRPDVEAEYNPARDALAAHGWGMLRFLRACLRWVRDDTDTALKTLAPHDPQEKP